MMRTGPRNVNGKLSCLYLLRKAFADKISLTLVVICVQRLTTSLCFYVETKSCFKLNAFGDNENPILHRYVFE